MTAFVVALVLVGIIFLGFVAWILWDIIKSDASTTAPINMDGLLEDIVLDEGIAEVLTLRSGDWLIIYPNDDNRKWTAEFCDRVTAYFNMKLPQNHTFVFAQPVNLRVIEKQYAKDIISPSIQTADKTC